MTPKKLQDVKDDSLLYHLTTFENIFSIFDNGLLSRKALKEQYPDFMDVADPEIIQKRHKDELEGYVPFHFSIYSAFDYVVKNNHPGKQFIYITMSRRFAGMNNMKIITAHPLKDAETPVLYDYQEGFDKIDWEKMKTKGNTDPAVKSVKMAEVLAEGKVEFKDLSYIIVPNEKIKRTIQAYTQWPEDKYPKIVIGEAFF